MKCCLNPASLFAYYPAHNPSEGSLGFLGRAALANWWNMNLGPVARNREVVSQKKCSQLYSSHRTLHFSQLLDDWSNPCDVFVWKVFIFSLDKSVHTTQSNPLSVDVSSFWSAVVGCGRELGKAVSESQVNKPSVFTFSSHLLCSGSADSVWWLWWCVAIPVSAWPHKLPKLKYNEAGWRGRGGDGRHVTAVSGPGLRHRQL